MTADLWAIGVDLENKVEVRLWTCRTSVPPAAACHQCDSRLPRYRVTLLQQPATFEKGRLSARGHGIGVAGQIDSDEGLVRFAPNLGWRDVPLQKDPGR